MHVMAQPEEKVTDDKCFLF